jgi:hypothetical protein
MSEPTDAKPSREPLRRHSVNALERVIEDQRTKLSQAHAVLKCLYEVLLHAEGGDAVPYAEAAHLTARLLEESIERLDPQRLKPLIQGASAPASYQPREEKLTLTGEGGDQVRDSANVVYMH